MIYSGYFSVNGNYGFHISIECIWIIDNHKQIFNVPFVINTHAQFNFNLSDLSASITYILILIYNYGYVNLIWEVI